FECGRAYLAAGAFDSTAILLRSLGATSRPVLLRQSDHFLLPVLLARGVPQVGAERLHTLSQAFIELLEGAVSSYGVHLQLYTYSDFYPRMARDRLGPFFPVMAPLLELLMARMSVLK